MKKRFTISCLYLCLFCTAPVQAQENSLLEKYRVMALEYNHDLKAAQKNISAAEELRKAARADLKPKLSGAANFQHIGHPTELSLDIPALGSPLHFKARDMKYGGSLSLVQPLYMGGSIEESIRMAQHQLAVAGYESDLYRSVICHQTDLQYWNTVASSEIVEVSREFRNSIADFTTIIRERVEVGLVDPQDLLMAEVKLNDAEYQLLRAQNLFETGRMALNSFIGVDLRAATEIEPTVPQVKWISETETSDGLDRPEIQMAHQYIKIAESSRKLTDAKYRPQLYIGVDGTYSSPGHDFRPELDPNYAVYAKLSVPIFEWGKRRNEKRASSFKVHMAADNLNKIKDNVSLETETARLSLTQAMERVSLTESSLEKAIENERKAMERYTEGEVSVVEVIDAQTYRQNAQINFVQAKTTAQYAYSDLIKALNLYESQLNALTLSGK